MRETELPLDNSRESKMPNPIHDVLKRPSMLPIGVQGLRVFCVYTYCSET